MVKLRCVLLAFLLAGCDTSIDFNGVRCAPTGSPCPEGLFPIASIEAGGSACRCFEMTGDGGSPDGGLRDAGTGDAGDAGGPDAGTADAGQIDAGQPDAGVFDAGLCGNGIQNAGEDCDDHNLVSGDGCEPTCKFTMTATVTGCAGVSLLPPIDGGACTVTPGNGDLLITGTVLAPHMTYVGGQVHVVNGVVACAGCSCTSSDGGTMATRVVCPGTVISPGLINTHEHLTFVGAPFAQTSERYEHRNDWRQGENGHTKLVVPPATQPDTRAAELRHLLSGTTSVIGSSSTSGNEKLVRNLDGTAAFRMMDGGSPLDIETFIFGDTAGEQLNAGCAYPSQAHFTRFTIAHVAEGISESAYNEARCFVAPGDGGPGFDSTTSVVQGVGVEASMVARWADAGVSLVWSPRSNVALYGDTAPMALYARYGVRVALGTDWVYTGSSNMLRELKCADHLNKTLFGSVYSDDDLWRMATLNGADLTDEPLLGRVAAGAVADLAFYRKKGEPHRSVIDAEPDDVVAVFRAGSLLYGDEGLVDALNASTTCETVDVCGVSKKVCIVDEMLTPLASGDTDFASISATAEGKYPLFTCGTPLLEPPCMAGREQGSNGSNTYPLTDGGIDTDGDGIPDTADDCPTLFNPIRPMDMSHQADLDGDGKGDVCDPCPGSSAANCP